MHKVNTVKSHLKALHPVSLYFMSSHFYVWGFWGSIEIIPVRSSASSHLFQELQDPETPMTVLWPSNCSGAGFGPGIPSISRQPNYFSGSNHWNWFTSEFIRRHHSPLPSSLQCVPLFFLSFHITYFQSVFKSYPLFDLTFLPSLLYICDGRL